MNGITADQTRQDRKAYNRVGFILLGGLLASVAVMFVGLALTGVNGSGGASHVVSLDQVIPKLLSGDRAAVLDCGILFLFATPLLGVVAALVEFAVQRDRDFVLVTGALLVMLAIAFAVALH